MRVADPRRLAGDDHIAEKSERGAEPDSVAVELADDGLFEIEQRIDDPLALGRDGGHAARLCQLRLHPVDVAAGAERSARARQDDEIDLLVPGDLTEDAGQLVVHARSHRVQRVRPAEREREDPSAPRDRDVFISRIVHGVSSVGSGCQAVLNIILI